MESPWKQFTELGIGSRDRLVQSTRWKLLLTYAFALIFVLGMYAFLQDRGYVVFSQAENVIILVIISCAGYYFVSNRVLHSVQREIRSHNQYLSDASHELRTPLTVMKTDLEIALRHPGDVEELKETMQSTLDEVERMHKIVEDLLMLSRNYLLKKGEESMHANLQELLKDIVTKLEGYARSHKVRLILEGVPKEQMLLRGDRRKLLQAFLNVTKNAIEFSKAEGGVVKIVISDVEAKTILISVEDNGIGIAPHDLPFIFNRFYQVDKSRAWQEAGGSGLGLSISKWIIQGYKGNLTAESKLGKGTKMKFLLMRAIS